MCLSLLLRRRHQGAREVHAADERELQVVLGSARGGGRVALHRSEGRNAAADRPPVRCSATRPTPRADPSERTVGGCFKKKKICRGPLRHIGPPLGQSPPSNIRPRSARQRPSRNRRHQRPQQRPGQQNENQGSTALLLKNADGVNFAAKLDGESSPLT